MPALPSRDDVRPVPLRVAILLFLLLWSIYGAAIKTSDLRAFGLQQAGVEALVEHGTLELGKSDHPRLQPRGDVFGFEGRLFPAKQPGQFVLGAMAYALVRPLGLSYDRDYIATAAWVTWLSASSFAALAPTLLFVLLVRWWGLGTGPALGAALVLALGTPLLAYSGVAHQDVISSALLLAAFVALEEARRGGPSFVWAIFGGLCGLVLFVSMLPAVMVAVLLAASLVGGSVRRAGLVGLGFLLGMLPLALHNWVYFHSPIVQNYMAGGYTSALFQPSLALLRVTVPAYLGVGKISLWLYAPAAGAGLLLLVRSAWLDPLRRPSAGVALAAVAAQLAYVLNITAIGGCQFGPRYLMPGLAFAVAGCGLQWDRARGPGSSGADRVLGRLLLLIAVVSVLIGVAGARTGAMICDLSTWVPLRALFGPLRPAGYPLATPMVAALLVVALAGLLLLRRTDR